MFNWVYAIVGVAIGYFIRLSPLFIGIIALTFLAFSASFGFQWLVAALIELGIGLALSGKRIDK
jgi:hypothetical protein